MKVSIEHELQLFPVRLENYETCRTLPPGRYAVEEVRRRTGERWWKLKGEDWGNAMDCWEAVRPGSRTAAQRVEMLSKKAALLAAALVFACILIKTDWVYVKEQPAVVAPPSIFAALARQYVQGGVYSVQAQPDGFLVARYASGWRILWEALSGRDTSFAFFQRHAAQVHKELLLLLMMAVALLCPNAKVIGGGLKFLVPLLLVPLLGTPASSPLLDYPLLFSYLGLAAAVAALVWNLPEREEKQSFWSGAFASVTGWLALLYNGALFSVLILLKL